MYISPVIWKHTILSLLTFWSLLFNKIVSPDIFYHFKAVNMQSLPKITQTCKETYIADFLIVEHVTRPAYWKVISWLTRPNEIFNATDVPCFGQKGISYSIRFKNLLGIYSTRTTFRILIINSLKINSNIVSKVGLVQITNISLFQFWLTIFF